MNLRDVRDALADTSVETSSALLKAKVLASLLRARELREYVDRELRGYAEDEQVPPYRQLSIDSVGTFVNPPHFAPVENHLVPTSDLPSELKFWAETYACTDSIGAIEKLLQIADKHMIWMPWPHENVAFIPETDIGGYGFRCTAASRCFSTEKLQGILDNVRNRVLDIVLDLGEQFPEQQENEHQLSAIPSAQIQTIVNNHIHGDFATIAAGAGVQQSVVTVEQNNIESLLVALKNLGVPALDREELRDAIIEDSREIPKDGKVGSRVRQWLGSLATKAAEKSLEVGVVAALPHIVDAVSKFFA
jgi:AbiTii